MENILNIVNDNMEESSHIQQKLIKLILRKKRFNLSFTFYKKIVVILF